MSSMDGISASELREFRKRNGFTQQEMADKLGIKRSRYANFEVGLSTPDADLMVKLRALGLADEVGPPTIPASQLQIPIPYLGLISASDPVSWTDPFDSDTFEFVPPEMGDPKGRFSCRVASDSMMPLLQPNDLCIFQKTDVPRIGHVILFRSFEHKITIKLLKHDGENFVLTPLNPKYESVIAEGTMLGYLVGIVREFGTQKMTLYDATGIRGQAF